MISAGANRKFFKYIFFNRSHASFRKTTLCICSGYCCPVRSVANFALRVSFSSAFLEKLRNSHYGMIPLARKIRTHLRFDVVH